MREGGREGGRLEGGEREFPFKVDDKGIMKIMLRLFRVAGLQIWLMGSQQRDIRT